MMLTQPTPKWLNFPVQAVRGTLNLINSPAVVLLYHRVIDLANDPQLLAVKPEHFRRQLEYLKKNFQILKVKEFTAILKKHQRFPPKSILITFDDGYADNYLQALPILESLDLQAVFYISTSYLDTQREFWWDDLERIFLLNHLIPTRLQMMIDSHIYDFDTSTPSLKETSYKRLHPLIKRQTKEAREKILQQLYTWSGLPREGRESHRLMTLEEVKRLSQSKSAVIGAHTHNHIPLSVLTKEEQFEEIKTSKNILENLLGTGIEHFSYPFGDRKDFNRDSIEMVKRLNFEMVTANFYWQAHSWTDPYQVPRMLVRDWDFDHFKKHITLFFKH